MSVKQVWVWVCDGCQITTRTEEQVLPDGWWERADGTAHLCPPCDRFSERMVGIKEADDDDDWSEDE